MVDRSPNSLPRLLDFVQKSLDGVYVPGRQPKIILNPSVQIKLPRFRFNIDDLQRRASAGARVHKECDRSFCTSRLWLGTLQRSPMENPSHGYSALHRLPSDFFYLRYIERQFVSITSFALALFSASRSLHANVHTQTSIYSEEACRVC